MNEDARLSKMLFEAREAVDMYADIVRSQTGKVDPWLRRLVDEIDTYRSERGWSLDGFGGEGSGAPQPSEGSSAGRNEIDCPRAKTWMTPCIARDGSLALYGPDPNDSTQRRGCVGCDADPRQLLLDLGDRYQPARRYRQTHDPVACADTLTRLVGEYVGQKE